MNINLQMNYWPADLCNLPETVIPLGNWLKVQAKKGQISAKKMYGAGGWVGFLAANPFGRTTPSGSTLNSQIINGLCDPLAGAWMSLTLWRHYQFSGDLDYLKSTAYPVLKGAVQFILDILIEDINGNLVVAPSGSPEHNYIDPLSGRSIRMTYGSTYHNEIIKELFAVCAEAAEKLQIDDAFQKRLKSTIPKLPLLKIGKDGTIQEWIKDYKEAEPGHRHVSHLVGLHPFGRISTESTPLRADAAKRTLQRRLDFGGGQTGWSRAWMINFYARLFEGDQALQHSVALLQKSTSDNLFDLHPPDIFQIDGNFGGTAGIAEMLLQSHNGTVHLLPALPAAWPAGEVKGLLARGGFEVDIKWNDGRLQSARILSNQGGTCNLKYGTQTVRIQTEKGTYHRVNHQLQQK